MILQSVPLLPQQGESPAIDLPEWDQIFRWDVLVPKLLQVVIVLVLALATYRLVRLLTRRLEREIQEEDPFVKRMREQRARTLASLLNYVALVIIVSISGLTILSVVIDIGPLLAAAGVAGLAISFGAQSLVKDVINGAFILMEGQFGIGDVVRIADASGQVEKITLRTTVLRDLEGAVHIIPNGEITRVSNLTKSWSRAVIDVRVDYREDVDRTLEVLRNVGRELRDDPAWGALLIEQPEVLGLQAFDESAMIIRMIAKTFPLKQWEVASELRRRIKIRFEEERIEIPFRQVTVHWGAGQSVSAALPRDPSPEEDLDHAGPGAPRRRLQS